MNSIDRNQPEDNHQDLGGALAVDKIREVFNRVQTCFFTTWPGTGSDWSTRPMTVQRVEEDGRLLFLSASDSRHNADILANPKMELTFQASAHSGFLHLRGTCTISTDRALIAELWKPFLKTWFTEGQDDPRITLLIVRPTEGEYWDTKNGTFVAGIKMLVGSVIGKTLDDSVTGKLRP